MEKSSVNGEYFQFYDATLDLVPTHRIDLPVISAFSLADRGGNSLTQLLYGQRVELVNAHSGVAQVRCLDHSWCKNGVWQPLEVAMPFDALQSLEKAQIGCEHRITRYWAPLFKNSAQKLKAQVYLPWGSHIEVNWSSESEYGVVTAGRYRGLLVAKRDVEELDDISNEVLRWYLISCAQKFVSQNYLQGGNTPPWSYTCQDVELGVDGPGLIYNVCNCLGIDVPRFASDQAKTVNPVGIRELQRGDLLFFASEPSLDFIDHVAIIEDPQLVIEASAEVGMTVSRPLSDLCGGSLLELGQGPWAQVASDRYVYFASIDSWLNVWQGCA